MTANTVNIKSQALERNLQETRVHIEIEARYLFLLEIFRPYPALADSMSLYLKELCNPFRSWEYLVNQAPRFCLEHLNLMVRHDQGTRAVGQFMTIYHQAIIASEDAVIAAEAAENLLRFLQQILREYNRNIDEVWPEVNRCLHRISQYDGDRFQLFVKSHYRLNRLAAQILKAPLPDTTDRHPLNRLLLKYHQAHCRIWTLEPDPLAAFERDVREMHLPDAVTQLFTPIGQQRMKTAAEELASLEASNRYHQADLTAELLKFPEFTDVVSWYRKLPEQLARAAETPRQGNHWKMILLFRIIHMPHLSMIHDTTLKEIHTTLRWLIDNDSSPNVRELIHRTFSILRERSGIQPEATLNAVLNMGKGVFNTKDRDLVDFFVGHVVSAGFQFPSIQGVGHDWQVRSNDAHILNIRVWMELIALNPHGAMSLMSHLVIYLSICGVFIKDTDLFGRDITHLLNSPIKPVYHLVKQLTRLFPVYYNEIGAEGTIRDLSTRIDELTRREDLLIHFYRKRIHVESSNRIIAMTQAIFRFWKTENAGWLTSYVPADYITRIQSDARHLDGVHAVILELEKAGHTIPDDLMASPLEEVADLIDHMSCATAQDRERVTLLARLYRLLYQKYTPAATEIHHYLDQMHTARIPSRAVLADALDALKRPEVKTKTKLQKLLYYLNILKKELLAPLKSEAREDIFKKRHFTADIPSLYGSYHEPKFDALGLTFRLESLVNPLFDELISELDLSLITRATIHKIHNRLRMLYTALNLDGITSSEFQFQMDLLAHALGIQGFTLTQYLDIFQSLTKAVQHIMNDFFHTVHQDNMAAALDHIPSHLLREKSRGMMPGDLKDQTAELFFRERMATALGLQQLDLFLGNILTNLSQQAGKLPDTILQKLLTYDPKRIVTDIAAPQSWVLGAMDLGNKGSNLVTLSSLGLPVPPGFIITTEAFRHLDLMDAFDPALSNFRNQVLDQLKHLEVICGRHFGDPDHPLLLSVRSGSVISLPGMMDTLINVGINEKIARGLAQESGNPWPAWDCFRRFIQCYGMIRGMKRDDFDAIMLAHKQKWQVFLKGDFSPKQMESVALAYQNALHAQGIDLPEDPFEQLFQAIRRVFNSWHAPRAQAYRHIMGLSHDWGTSVTVQQMVFGNVSPDGGTGVVLTHDPRSPRREISLWGDFTRNSQGEDVVAGLVNTFPISITQQEREMRNTDTTLESHFPHIYDGLLSCARTLIKTHGWGPQEIEFTFEGPDKDQLYILQTRDLAIREQKMGAAFDPAARTEAREQYLGHGIGVSGGAVNGRLVFTLEEIEKWRKKEPETPLILVRNDTVPDDIREIHAADGILTARGGMTSHAAIVAHRLGKTCVVGFRSMVCNEPDRWCRFEGLTLYSGDMISLDGHRGAVYHGCIPVIQESGQPILNLDND